MYQDTELQTYLAKAHLQELREVLTQERMRARLARTGLTLRHRVAAPGSTPRGAGHRAGAQRTVGVPAGPGASAKGTAPRAT